MGVGPFSTESKASQANVQTGDNSPSLKNSKVSTLSGLFIDKAKLAKGASINISQGTDSGPVVADLSKTFASTLSNLSGGVTDALQTALNKQTTLTQDALSKVSDLAQSQQTGGASQTNKTVLWIVLGVLGFLGVVFYFTKK